jgi:glycosyltransferase involved in cell wall biosynthesis
VSLVAVIVPVYNGERFLHEALRSVRTQAFASLGIIMIHDGSTDTSPEIAQRHVAEEPRVGLVSKQNRSVAAARSTGIELTDAPLVALLDAYDVSLRERFEREVQFRAENPDLAAVGTHGWRIGQDGGEFGVFDVAPISREHFAELRARNEVIYLLASAVMLRRDVAASVGGFRDVTYAEAPDLSWTRIADEHVVLGVADRLVRYRVHPGSDSSRHFFRQMESERLIKANCRPRRSGLPEIGIGALRGELRAEPMRTQIRRHATWRSQFSYRVASGLLANRDPNGLAWLALSFVIAPAIPVGRLCRHLIPWLVARR